LLFLRLLDAPETDEGAATGFFRRHAVADVLFDREVNVTLKFGVGVGVAPAVC
jgi:hypothetical protein